jgi:hypothetical protein
VAHHRFKVTLEVTLVDLKEPQAPDGPVDPVVTAELTRQMKNLKAKKGAAEYTVQQVTVK